MILKFKHADWTEVVEGDRNVIWKPSYLDKQLYEKNNPKDKPAVPFLAVVRMGKQRTGCLDIVGALVLRRDDSMKQKESSATEDTSKKRRARHAYAVLDVHSLKVAVDCGKYLSEDDCDMDKVKRTPNVKVKLKFNAFTELLPELRKWLEKAQERSVEKYNDILHIGFPEESALKPTTKSLKGILKVKKYVYVYI